MALYGKRMLEESHKMVVLGVSIFSQGVYHALKTK